MYAYINSGVYKKPYVLSPLQQPVSAIVTTCRTGPLVRLQLTNVCSRLVRNFRGDRQCAEHVTPASPTDRHTSQALQLVILKPTSHCDIVIVSLPLASPCIPSYQCSSLRTRPAFPNGNPVTLFVTTIVNEKRRNCELSRKFDAYITT
jgi:hypothetical protein